MSRQTSSPSTPSVFTPGIKIFIGTMGIDFLLWGCIDPFFSVFTNALLENLFLVGLIGAVRGVAGLLFLGPLCQLMIIKSPVFVALLGRVMTGIALGVFLMAGVFVLPYLLFLGAFILGIGGASRDVATREYLMASSPKTHVSTILGTNFSIRWMAWMMAAIGSGYFYIFLQEKSWDILQIMSLVFILVVPFLLVSVFFLRKISSRNKSVPIPFSLFRPYQFLKAEKNLLSRISHCTTQAKFSLSLICFLQIIQTSLVLFLPLLALDSGLTLVQVGMLMASMRAPILLSSLFSIFEDRFDRMLFIIVGLLFSVLPFLLLSQASTPLSLGVFSILISLSLAIIMPANLGVIASVTPASEVSTVAALQIFFQRIGALFGALVLGVIAQNFGISSVFALLAFLATFFALFALFIRYSFIKESHVPYDHPFRVHAIHISSFHTHHL